MYRRLIQIDFQFWFAIELEKDIWKLKNIMESRQQ